MALPFMNSQIDPQRRIQMGQALMQGSMGQRSTTGLGALGQALGAYFGGRQVHQGEQEQRQQKQQKNQALLQALSQQDPTYQGIAQQLAETNPEVATQFAMRGLEQRLSQQKPKGREPIKVGSQLVDPDTFEVLFTGQERGPTTTVNVGQGQAPLSARERILEEDVMTRAKSARDRNQETLEAGSQSRTTIPRLERGLELLKTVKTGTGQEAFLTLAKAANALGLDVNAENIASAEELQTILGDRVMGRVAQTKGAVSEKEMDLFRQFSANFGKTNEGNERIMRFALAIEERNAAKADLVRQMRREGATSLEIQDATDQFMFDNDLSGMLSGLPPVGQQGAVTPPAAPAEPAGGTFMFQETESLLDKYAPLGG